MIDGVSASCVGLPAGPWLLLLDFLVARMPGVSREQWLLRMEQQRVLDEQGMPLAPNALYRAHTRVYYYREIFNEPRIPFDEVILFQNEHLVVVDKPHFLPVMPAGRFLQETVLVRLKRKLKLEHLVPVHRIDRETAGLVLFCIKPEERAHYHEAFRHHQVQKTYEAIAPLRADTPLPAVYKSRIEPDAQFFRQREVPGEANSETHFELLATQNAQDTSDAPATPDTRGALARYRLRPITGKTHQLRVHMNALGRPIVGDLLYPHAVHGAGEPHLDASKPLQLLAQSLAFADPVTGEKFCFTSQQQLNWPTA